DQVVVDGSTVYVMGSANKPAEDAMTTQALTYPYHAVVVPRIDDAAVVIPRVESLVGMAMPEVIEVTEDEPADVEEEAADDMDEAAEAAEEASEEEAG
ncbi:MAG: protease complex subunit PrcB family protein, partial [Phycisphaeraceae bacterium]|nr:protease complex subunit PrcB family protein [Phycisphaeraceae bacterium]